MPRKDRYDKMKCLVKDGSARNVDAIQMKRPDGQFFTHNLAHLPIVIEAESLVRQWAREVDDVAARTWGVHQPTDVKFGWEHWRRTSRGGRYAAVWRSRLNEHPLPTGPGINMNMGRHVPRKDTQKPAVYPEYAHLSPWGDVGEFKCTWRDGLRAATYHECSHAILYAAAAKLFDLFQRKHMLSAILEDPTYYRERFDKTPVMTRWLSNQMGRTVVRFPELSEVETTLAGVIAKLSQEADRAAAETGIPFSADMRAHGVAFTHVYSHLRRHFTLVDTSKPLWSDLTMMQKALVENWKNLPSNVALWIAAESPEAYQRERRRLNQSARRSKKREQRVTLV